jgi:hypothetical protein
MKRAHHRDAINKEKFWFRRTCSKANDDNNNGCSDGDYGVCVCWQTRYAIYLFTRAPQELTINEIINGTDPACGDVERIGLVGLIGVYLDSIGVGETERAHIDR